MLENVRNYLISSATFADFHNQAMEIVNVLNDFNSEISKTITLQQDVSAKQEYDNFDSNSNFSINQKKHIIWQ